MFHQSANTINDDIESKIQNFKILANSGSFSADVSDLIMKALMHTKSGLSDSAISWQTKFTQAIDIATLQIEKYHVADGNLIIATLLDQYLQTQSKSVRSQMLDSLKNEFGSDMLNILKGINYTIFDAIEVLEVKLSEPDMFKTKIFADNFEISETRFIRLSEFHYHLSKLTLELDSNNDSWALALLEVMEKLQLNCKLHEKELDAKCIEEFNIVLRSVFPENIDCPRIETAIRYFKTLDFIAKNISDHSAGFNILDYFNSLFSLRDFEFVNDLLLKLPYGQLKEYLCLSILVITNLPSAFVETRMPNRKTAFQIIVDLFKDRGLDEPGLFDGLQGEIYANKKSST